MKDLTPHQEELQLLVEGEQKYRNMFENATEGIFQATPGGRFLSANPALARIAGYDSPEDLMKSVTNIAQQVYVSPDRRLEWVKLLETDGRVSNVECQVYRKDGTTHWVSLSSKAVCDKTDKVLYFEGHVHDITEKKRAEEQLLLQRDLALELAKVSSLDEALALTIHAVKEAFGCDCAGIYLRNSATGDLELASCAGLSEDFRREASHAALGSDAWRLLSKEEPTYFSVHDDMDVPFREALIAEGVRSLALIPILYQGGIIACFNAGVRGTDAIPASSRSILELIGAQFGNIIARLLAERKLRKDLQGREQAEDALEAKTCSLEEMNSALKVLLNGREKDKNELADKLLSNTEQLVLPYVRKLKSTKLDLTQQAWVDIIETNLREITSPFLKNIAAYDFTPKELEVVQLMKAGRSSKEIADLLHVGVGAIEMHRHHIRKKLGLHKKKTNLQAYLFSLV